MAKLYFGVGHWVSEIAQKSPIFATPISYSRKWNECKNLKGETGRWVNFLAKGGCTFKNDTKCAA